MFHLNNNEINIILHAVRRACNLTHSIFQALLTHGISDNTFLIKEDYSPVTIADFGSQAIINAILKETFPLDAIFAEETSTLLYLKKELIEKIWNYVNDILYKDTMNIGKINNINELLDIIDYGNKYEKLKISSLERWWVIDPIDGTQGFLRGEQYVVSLALIIHGQPYFGVLGCPQLYNNTSHSMGTLGTLFYAIQGKGAYQQALDMTQNTVSPIHINTFRELAQAYLCESIVPTHSALDIQKEIATTLGIINPSIRVDSQIKYALVASGKADIYLRLPSDPNYCEKTWDHAAGALIVQEAGGIVTDIHGKKLDFSKTKTLTENNGIVATSKHLHAKVLECIASILKK
ncbi:hypothetical protein PCANB_002600 [Pneumocystis canis]|nr:hypothetical protein PCK1_002750 [Pneumocystis canis]KAG5438496.1 hypothetical protein PCANB_002600 [Pneumocystis canis]